MTDKSPYVVSLRKKLTTGDTKDEWGSLKHHAEDFAENYPSDFFNMLEEFLKSDNFNIHSLCFLVELYLRSIDKDSLFEKTVVIFRNQDINRRKREQIISSLNNLIRSN